MATQTRLIDDLQSIVGAENAFEPSSDNPFAVDDMNPQAVARPGTYEEVAAIMRYANERGLAVIPWGSGALMHIGNSPRCYDLAISMSRLNKIIEYEPADLTVTCQAGISLREINENLRESRQMTPFGPWGELPSIGGLVAANENGFRLAFGGPRDFTIGMRVITADGRITRAGGRVVKNVAGYDLCKLYAGSRGTMGVIAEVGLKLVPLPEVHEWWIGEFGSISTAFQFAVMIQKQRLSVWKLDISRLPVDAMGEPRGSVAVRAFLAGAASSVNRSRREIEALASHVGILTRENLEVATSNVPGGHRPGILACLIHVLPSLTPALVDSLDRKAPGAFLEIRPLEGSALASWADADRDHVLLSQVRTAVSALNGTLVVADCSTELKHKIDVFGEPPPSFELMRRIKQEFDPNGILSPGRFVGKL